MSFSHLGARAADTFEPVDVRECIQEAARLVRLSHDAKHVEFDTHGTADVIVAGDRTRLRQVFVNLLTNATDASPPNDACVNRAPKRSTSRLDTGAARTMTTAAGRIEAPDSSAE